MAAWHEGGGTELRSFALAAGDRLRQLCAQVTVGSLPEAAAVRASAHHLTQLRVLPAAAETGVLPSQRLQRASQWDFRRFFTQQIPEWRDSQFLQEKVRSYIIW